MPTYRTIKGSDWTKSLLFIGIYVATISITAFILLVTYWRGATKSEIQTIDVK